MLSWPGTWEDYLINQEAGGSRKHTAQLSLLVKGMNSHLCEPRKMMFCFVPLKSNCDPHRKRLWGDRGWEVRDTPGFYDNPLWGHPAPSAHGLSATPEHVGMQALGLWSAGPSSVAERAPSD